MVKKLTRRQLDEIERQKRLDAEMIPLPGKFPRRIRPDALALSIDVLLR